MVFLEALMIWIRFSNVVPNGTKVPGWAFLDVTVSWGCPYFVMHTDRTNRIERRRILESDPIVSSGR